MRTIVVIAGVAGAALLGGGIWLGRASTRTPAPVAEVDTAGPPRPDPAPRAARTTRTAMPPQPALSASQPVSREMAADLADADPRVRRAAVRELSRTSDPDPAALLAASRDPDLDVGVIATEALGKLHARGAVSTADLIARATDHRLDERVRVSALNGLGQVPSKEAASLLIDLTQRGDVSERRTAAILLAHQDPEVAVPALIRSLQDADDVVRSNAQEALRARSRGRDFGTDASGWQAWWQSRPR